MAPETTGVLHRGTIHWVVIGTSWTLCGLDLVGGDHVPSGATCPRCRNARRSGTYPKVELPQRKSKRPASE